MRPNEFDDVAYAAAVRTDGLLTVEAAYRLGLTYGEIHARVRSGRWRTLGRGLYLVEPDLLDADTVRRASIRAALSASGPGSVAVYETAAELLRLPVGASRPELIHVSTTWPKRDLPWVRFHQVPDDDAVLVKGIRCASPRRTVADLLRRLDRLDAIAAADASLYKGLLRRTDLPDLAKLLHSKAGAIEARQRLTLVDGRAESPLESRVRVICVDGGVGPDDLQFRICDQDGVILARADLAWIRSRVIGEADGAAAVFRDRARQNALIAQGWTVLRFTWADTYRPDYIVGTVAAALRRS